MGQGGGIRRVGGLGGVAMTEAGSGQGTPFGRQNSDRQGYFGCLRLCRVETAEAE